MVEELVLAIVAFDPHARPIAGTYRALIVRAVMPSNALADFETFGLGWSHLRSLPTYSLIVHFSKRQCRPTSSPIRRDLILRHYAFEVFGLAFDAISNSSVRLDWQLLNHRINGRLLNGHSSLRSLTQVTNVIFWLVNIGHFSPRSFALSRVICQHCDGFQ